ncbi:MAG: hypothetical protein AAGG02_21485 [Cyanobacteria bacterium P01_H01_bin.15]
MALNTNALSSTFRIGTVRQREEQAAFRKWQACFYTIRHLLWSHSKGSIFREAVENGIIEPVAPGVREESGNWQQSEYDQDDIRDLYKEAWEQFTAEFDAAFVNAGQEELVSYSETHLGMNETELLELNQQRSAERHQR